MDRKRKSELSDHVSIKDQAHHVESAFKDYLLLVKEWLIDYGKVILPLVVIGSVIVTVVIALNARDRVQAAEKEAVSILESNKEEIEEVKEIEFEENAYPEINQLFVNYYNALKGADVDALVSIQNNITNTEIIRLQAMSEYIDHYDNLKVYTKPGPIENSFVVYAYTDVYLINQDVPTPGLQAFYVCFDDEKGYYINTGELSEGEANYIYTVSNQDDVVDLKNTVNVAYNTLLEDNEEISKYWAGISVEIDKTVGEQLSEEAAIEAKLAEEERIANGEEEITPEMPEEPKIVQVRTNTMVNVRKSASATADKIGTSGEGKTYDVIERMTNGWTKIDFGGTEGYIKTEFLDDIEDMTNVESTGKATATTLLNVRAEASASAEKLGVLNQGQIVELVEELDGWCKIKFNGQIGYVSKDFVTIQ